MDDFAGDVRLFESELVEPDGELMVRARVDKRFRPYDPDQLFLMPPSLNDWLPEGHLARFVGELVDEGLDLEPFLVVFTEARGFSPYNPRLMLKLLIYGYTTGVCSAREMERRCHDDVAFRFLAANAAPDHRSISRFRRTHLEALSGLFLQSLKLCEKAGMVSLGRVALDGTKRRANASRHKAMSYDRMVEREAVLQAEVDVLLAEAETVDCVEDVSFGAGGTRVDLPAELARRESRLVKIRRARADLEADESLRAAAKAADKARKRGLDEVAVEAAADAAGQAARPAPKSQRNFTDPDSRIMKTSDGSFHQCYNAQTVVDDAFQVIVATALSNRSADGPELPGMLDAVTANCGRAPGQLLADAGYFSESNIEAATQRGVDVYIATGRLKHHEQVPAAPRGPIPKNATPKQRMARKLRTKEGHATYARRKAIVEPVFGQMDTVQDAKHLLLRGETAAAQEWDFLAAGHNLLKVFRVVGVDVFITN